MVMLRERGYYLQCDCKECDDFYRREQSNHEDSDGWIEFDGYERPSGYFNTVIDVKLECGKEITDSSGRFEWDTKGPSRIIAYRMHKPDLKPEFCESVTRSIPEPEAKPTIEQLAQDYRNAKDYAERLQKEADEAWITAENAKCEIIDAGNKLELTVIPHSKNTMHNKLVR